MSHTFFDADIIIQLDGQYFAVELDGGTYSSKDPVVQPLLITYLGTGAHILSLAHANDDDQINIRTEWFMDDLRALFYMVKGRYASRHSDFTFIKGEDQTYTDTGQQDSEAGHIT